MNAMDLTKMGPNRSEPFDRLMKAVMTGPGHTNSFEGKVYFTVHQYTVRMYVMYTHRTQYAVLMYIV